MDNQQIPKELHQEVKDQVRGLVRHMFKRWADKAKQDET